MSQNSKTDATIEQLSDFLAEEIWSSFRIGHFENDGSFYDVHLATLAETFQELLIKFTMEHPIREYIEEDTSL